MSLFQTYTLYPWMNVADNVGFGLKLQGVPPVKRKQSMQSWEFQNYKRLIFNLLSGY